METVSAEVDAASATENKAVSAGGEVILIADLPGVGENYQDHPRIDCVWEFAEPLPPRNNGGDATVFWKSDPASDTPDLQICVAEFPLASPDNAAKYALPQHGWTLAAALLRPKAAGVSA
jgi:choline dehydrogenase